MSTDEKQGTTSCATSCAACGPAETLFFSEEEREIFRLRGERDRWRSKAIQLGVALLEGHNYDVDGDGVRLCWCVDPTHCCAGRPDPDCAANNALLRELAILEGREP